jgi:hypothetical protein
VDLLALGVWATATKIDDLPLMDAKDGMASLPKQQGQVSKRTETAIGDAYIPFA